MNPSPDRQIHLSILILFLALAAQANDEISRAGLRSATPAQPEAIGSPSPKPSPAVKAVNQSVFADLVNPILQQKCLGCHSAERHRGGLRVDNLDALAKGGESGAAFIKGQAKDSRMIQRLLLPLTHEEHMPPKGRPQPTSDEIAALQWWIDAGAPSNQTIAELQPPAPVQRLLATVSSPPQESPLPRQAEDTRLLAQRLSDDLGVIIAPLAQNEPWLQCNASLAGKEFGDQQLARLAPLQAQLRWLDLAGTGITDTGLPLVSQMKHLTRLHLERTAVTDVGMAELASLSELEYLNLYGTPVSNAGITGFKSLKKLRKLYLWQTKVTPEAAQSLGTALVDQDQIQRWREEIESLKDKIRAATVEINLGHQPAPVQSTAGQPANTKCPVSGKDIDPTKTLTYEGRVIAFCCDDCKAQFQKDPKKFLSKL